MSNTGSVTVIQGERPETYRLNDGIVTVGDAIAKFGPHGDYKAIVNGVEIDEGSDLRAGDVILLLSANTVSGGLKGA